MEKDIKPARAPAPPPSPPSRIFRVSTIVFLIVMLFFLIIDFWMISGYLLTVFLGGILALLTYPLDQRLQKSGLGRHFSALIVVIATVLLILVPIGWFMTIAIQEGIAFTSRIAHSGSLNVHAWIDRLSHLSISKTLIGNPDAVQAQIQNWLRTVAASASSLLLGALGSLPAWILETLLVLVAQYFFLVDGKRFVGWLNDKLPLDPEVRVHLYASFRDTAISTIWASVASAAVQAVILGFAFYILGIPAPFLAAGATFIAAWIPVVGSVPIFLIGILYCALSQHSLWKAFAMLGFGILTAVADNFIRPYVLRGRGDMHPLVSLLAIFGGVELFGFFGVFYGPILVAVFLALAQVWPVIARRLGWMAATPATQSEIRSEIRRQLKQDDQKRKTG